MKKKIGIGVIALSIMAGAFVFAKNTSNNCPNRPDCVCPNNGTAQVDKVEAKKASCPNTPNCVCIK